MGNVICLLNNATRIENSKLIGRRVTEAMSDTGFKCKVVAVIVADFSDVMTPCHISLSPLRLLC